jgi:hypothetical protein
MSDRVTKGRCVRVDVQQRFKYVAAEMLAIEDTYLVRVSRAVVDHQAGEWSDAVQYRFVPSEDGVVEVEVRRFEIEAACPA